MNQVKYPHTGAPIKSGKTKCHNVKIARSYLSEYDKLIRCANEEYDRQCEENGDV